MPSKINQPGFNVWPYIEEPELLAKEIASGIDLRRLSGWGYNWLHSVCSEASQFEPKTIARCMTMLLDAGADVERISASEQTTIMVLASSYQDEPDITDDILDLFDILIERGAKIEAKSAYGETVMDYAPPRLRAHLEAWVISGKNPRKVRVKVRGPRPP